MKLVTFFLLIFFIIESCDTNSSKKNKLSITPIEWHNKIRKFENENCNNSKHLEIFNETILKRGILKKIKTIVNGPLAYRKINNIIISGHVFDIGKISVTILEDKIGYNYVSQDTICHQLYLSYQFDITPNVEEVEGCLLDKDNQNVKVSIKLDKNGQFRIFSIKSY